MIDQGLQFVMDFNKDRWGFQPLNDDTFNDGPLMTKNVLKNQNLDFVENGENARIYFPNIGNNMCNIYS